MSEISLQVESEPKISAELDNPQYYINRELSLLATHARVKNRNRGYAIGYHCFSSVHLIGSGPWDL
jgi:hypothetical protein